MNLIHYVVLVLHCFAKTDFECFAIFYGFKFIVLNLRLPCHGNCCMLMTWQ